MASDFSTCDENAACYQTRYRRQAPLEVRLGGATLPIMFLHLGKPDAEADLKLGIDNGHNV